MTTEAGAERGLRVPSFRLDNGGRGHEPRNADDLKKLERTKKQILPWSFQKENSSTNTSILVL